MAEIDKGLPNTRTELKVPAPEQEVDVTEQQEQKGPVEVTPDEDGGATIDFDPGAINIPGTDSHFDNLADILPADIDETPLKGERPEALALRLADRLHDPDGVRRVGLVLLDEEPIVRGQRVRAGEEVVRRRLLL